MSAAGREGRADRAGSFSESVGRVALVGCGRFGRAFAALALSRGLALRAFDPDEDAALQLHAEEPAAERAGSLAEAVADVDVVVLAVPVGALADALTALAPHLAPRQLVVDVSSVKLGPVATLTAALGARVPWVATHPLFGPTSVKEEGRVPKVIVCPQPLHPGAASRARALYEGLGCTVVEMDAAAHDVLMAETQAVAFFVGEGLRDAGFGGTSAWGPPSAESLCRLAGGATAEGGHVRDAILGQNPHAAAARTRLLGALASLERRYESYGSETIESLIAAQPEAALAGLRARIDALDHELLRLLTTRAAVARDISRAKEAVGRPVRDPPREEAALEVRRAWARALGLDVGFVEQIFEDIMVWSRALQEEVRRR